MEGSGKSRTAASNGTLELHCNAPYPTNPVTVPKRLVMSGPDAESADVANGFDTKSHV